MKTRQHLITAALVLGAFSGAGITAAVATTAPTTPVAAPTAQVISPAPVIDRGARVLKPSVQVPTALPSAEPTAQVISPAPVITRAPRPVKPTPTVVGTTNPTTPAVTPPAAPKPVAVCGPEKER